MTSYLNKILHAYYVELYEDVQTRFCGVLCIPKVTIYLILVGEVFLIMDLQWLIQSISIYDKTMYDVELFLSSK